MRIRIISFLLYLVILPFIVLRHILTKKRSLSQDTDMYGGRCKQSIYKKGKKRNLAIDTKELDGLLNSEISSENIL
mgnify:CR=1 FL=1